MQTQKTAIRFGTVLAVLLALALLRALPARAATYDEAVAQLERLQTLADSYAAQNGGGDSLDLVLSYARQPAYNTAVWQMVAGVPDVDFDAYVVANAPDLAEFRFIGTVSLPNGQNIDFSHLLASLQMVYKKLPVCGSWGGDSMQLVQMYLGQAADAEGYMGLMQATFNAGGESVFGNEDVRADMDSVILGSALAADTRLAALLQSYYTPTLTDYERAQQFIALTFGAVDTGNQSAFRQAVYTTLVEDTGMQLLLYLYGMWQQDGWQLSAEAEPALRGAANVFADYLAAAVNGERVAGVGDTLMTTVASQALADLLTAMGYPEAAQAAVAAAGRENQQVAEAAGVDGVLENATQHLRERFDAALFRTVLLAVAAAAVAAAVVFLALAAREYVLRR